MTGETARVPAALTRSDARSLSRFGRVRVWIGSAVAAVLGVLPHVLHHAGPLAGAALLGGVSGSLLFGAIGFVAAIPFMLRLRRRSGSWRLPAAAMAVFAIVFSISTFVIGPAINGSESGTSSTPTAAPQQGGSSPPSESQSAHESHH